MNENLFVIYQISFIFEQLDIKQVETMEVNHLQNGSKEREIHKTSGLTLQLVTFHIENEIFALHIQNIREINKMVDITRVPNTPHFIRGVINLRGRVIPVVDLRKKLNLPTKENTKDTRIIIIENNNITVGFVVDAVSEVLRIDSSFTEAPPATFAGVESDYISSIAKLEDRLVTLLDLDAVLAKNE